MLHYRFQHILNDIIYRIYCDYLHIATYDYAWIIIFVSKTMFSDHPKNLVFPDSICDPIKFTHPFSGKIMQFANLNNEYIQKSKVMQLLLFLSISLFCQDVYDPKPWKMAVSGICLIPSGSPVESWQADERVCALLSFLMAASVLSLDSYVK